MLFLGLEFSLFYSESTLLRGPLKSWACVFFLYSLRWKVKRQAPRSAFKSAFLGDLLLFHLPPFVICKDASTSFVGSAYPLSVHRIDAQPHLQTDRRFNNPVLSSTLFRKPLLTPCTCLRASRRAGPYVPIHPSHNRCYNIWLLLRRLPNPSCGVPLHELE